MDVDKLTAPQFRMARAALGMSRPDIATRAGVSAEAIAIAETDPSRIKIAALEAIQRFYNAKGVWFTRDAGRVGALLRL
jgi:transcriptional regulator with XRE-family HTH domain